MNACRSKRRLQASLPFFIAAAIALLSPTLAAARSFEDQFGRVIEADLVSHWGAASGYVKINKDGKLLTVKTSAFSATAQKEIVDWMRNNPNSLAALVEPERAGQGLVAGKQWIFINGSRRTLLEFVGADLIKRNGVLDKESHWEVTADKHLSFSWRGYRKNTFDKPVIGERIYRSSASDSVMLVKRDRQPAPATSSNIAGKTFVLVYSRALSDWDLRDRSVGVVDFLKGGEAKVGSNSYKWKVEGGSIKLSTRTGEWATFGGLARDIYIDRRARLLWEVPPPDLKKR